MLPFLLASCPISKLYHPHMDLPPSVSLLPHHVSHLNIYISKRKEVFPRFQFVPIRKNSEPSALVLSSLLKIQHSKCLLSGLRELLFLFCAPYSICFPHRGLLRQCPSSFLSDKLLIKTIRTKPVRTAMSIDCFLSMFP